MPKYTIKGIVRDLKITPPDGIEFTIIGTSQNMVKDETEKDKYYNVFRESDGKKIKKIKALLIEPDGLKVTVPKTNQDQAPILSSAYFNSTALKFTVEIPRKNKPADLVSIEFPPKASGS